MPSTHHTAVLLLNVGSPQSPSPWHVATYLTEFLTDKHVLHMPWLFRQLLVRGFIVPFRSFQSAAKYKRIWTAQGSPLLRNTQKQQQGLQRRLPHMRIFFAMRYGEPSIASAVDTLVREAPSRLLAVPMFVHDSAATTGTGLEELKRCLARHASAPSLRVVEPLSALPAFNQSLGQKIRRHVQSFKPEHLLFSYHGLPLSHVRAEGGYVEQCHATSQTLAAHLEGLPFSTTFQSRMRGSAWTSPFTFDTALSLAHKGVSRLMVACPSFSCDCLETLEEINIGLGEVFLRAGGKAFACVPCLNDEPSWLDGLAQRLKAEVQM